MLKTPKTDILFLALSRDDSFRGRARERICRGHLITAHAKWKPKKHKKYFRDCNAYIKERKNLVRVWVDIR